MKIIVDMNLSPAWCALLEANGHEALHWQLVGNPSATDATILTWARDNGFVVFTNDLDFGAILAATSTRYPSVVQLRGRDVTPRGAGASLLAVLARYAPEIGEGVLLTIDQGRCRVRMLPVRRPAS